MKQLLSALLIVGLIMAVLSGIIILPELIAEDRYARRLIQNQSEWISKNQELINKIYTDIFPMARECAEKGSIPSTFHSYVDHCNGKLRYEIDQRYDAILDICSRSKYKECVHGGRPPVYFIKLQDENHIEKLFQSGTYFVDTVDTHGEREVVKMLQGKRNPFRFPLYHCCGGDDWLENFSLILPERVYLKDFPTEIDYIFPIKDDKGNIIGGLVMLYGD